METRAQQQEQWYDSRFSGGLSPEELGRFLGGDWIAQVAPLPVAQQPAAREHGNDAARVPGTRPAPR